MEDYKKKCEELVRRLNEASEAYYNGKDVGRNACIDATTGDA